MPTISQLRTGLATRLGTISGLRTTATIPDQINPPVAIVALDSIAYDTAFARGLDQYTFRIMVITGRVAERTSQTNLDLYLAPTGSGSVKTAIEGDRSLGGSAQTLRVTDMSDITPVMVGDANYLSVTFMVTVYA